MIDNQFNHWLVLAFAGRRRTAAGVIYLVKCRCRCGNEKTVNAGHVKGNRSQSCGCYHSEQLCNRNRSHGKSDYPEYQVWKAIHTRCKNVNHAQYADYGGRGLSVCKSWSGSRGFARFLKDMGRRPGPGSRIMIERRNNAKGYSPGNCYWATVKTQMRNKRNNITKQYNGKTQCLAAWAEELHIPYGRLHYRITVLGWSLQKAVETPPRGSVSK